ncbi:terpenoid synthase [Gautieria morchelliformis]|nr:terpenoid synthase [Gautieria morchelliformis]
MDPSPPSDPTILRIPDITSHCPFKLAYHKNGDALAADSETGSKEGVRSATSSDDRFRVVCDMFNVWWLLDDLSEELRAGETEILADFYKPTHAGGKEQPDEEPDVSRLSRDYWTRFISKAGPGVQARLVHNFELCFIALNQEVKDRISGPEIPSLADFIKRRQDTSACKQCFDLIEYCFDMELPDYVIENPSLESMKDCVNSFASWLNDIYSYNVDQSRGITHNLVTVIMKHYDMDLQAAVDHAGNMCIEAIESYCEHKARLPSYGPEIDSQVAAYTRGLESWISGNLEWILLTQRYFGNRGQEVKAHLLVKLLPPKQSPNAALVD